MPREGVRTRGTGVCVELIKVLFSALTIKFPMTVRMEKNVKTIPINIIPVRL